MVDAGGFMDTLHAIASRISENASERDVESACLQEGLFYDLGYEGIGHDLRSEWKLPDNKRPDYATLNDNQSVTAVFEFKNPSEDLSGHEAQLFHYTKELKSDYGVLLNGKELRLFSRQNGSHDRTRSVVLAQATETDAKQLISALQKPRWDTTDPEIVTRHIESLDPVSLEDELGREEFFETFRLEQGSPFANLVISSMDLLRELRDEQDTDFVKGAFDFWNASYASEPEEIPDSWEPFIDGEASLRDFMFCLESGHALLARLLLAKASDDHEFFPSNRGLRGYLDELPGFGERIDPDAYPIAAHGLMEDMRNQLVESLFEDDIFIWWMDAFQETTVSQHATPFSRFRDVARAGSEVTRVSDPTRIQFSRAVADVFFSTLKFNFARIEGDPLGNLYQRYFDPETRQALGEFYTPEEIVSYIFESVEYEYGVSAERLIDPACGSGTFLVEAVRRYKQDIRRYNEDPDWEEHLRDLCSRPQIVGLDIHPFAVLMAQIRFMVEILPEYRDAKRENPQFTIRRLPIYRTDSLRKERELADGGQSRESGTQLTLRALTEKEGDVRIPVPLPIEVEDQESVETEGEFLVQRVRMPLFESIQRNTGIRNFGEYFGALQGVMDVAKFHMNEEMWEYQGGLREGINRYTSRNQAEIEQFFEPYVNDILHTVKYLREDHGDGRLFKMLEDSVLALVVKNYMTYEYVVGNPPYVNIKNIPDRDQTRYKQDYESAYGRFDLYILFLERGLEWLSEGGKLGYITSNKFTRSRYGQEIRRVISSEYSLEKYIEFGDVEIFTDATNFASILIIDRDLSRKEVSYAKVHEAGEDIFRTLDEYLGEEDILTESLEISKYPLNQLNSDNWRFTPRPVRRVEQRIRDRSTNTIEDVSIGVREGVASGGDEAFMVSPEYAEQNRLEDSLLWPIIRGKSVRRWAVTWECELVIYPYDEDGKLVDLDEFPNIKAHLDEHEEDLRDRYCVKKGGKDVYEYHGPHPKSMFEGGFKIAVPDMATENHFCFTKGYDCFKNTVYVLTFNQNIAYEEKELVGILNSSVAEFSIKQTSPPLRGKPFRYRYKSQYVNQIPLPDDTGNVGEIVDEILQLEEIEERLAGFPEAYIEEFEGAVDSIKYVWQTGRSPVDCRVEELDDGRYVIKAGRTDEISSPILDRGDSRQREIRAEYLKEAVDGRHFDSGEEVTIPIPTSEKGVRELLARLDEDRQEVSSKPIKELEKKLDQEVFRLFEISPPDQDIIGDYIDIF